LPFSTCIRNDPLLLYFPKEASQRDGGCRPSIRSPLRRFYALNEPLSHPSELAGLVSFRQHSWASAFRAFSHSEIRACFHAHSSLAVSVTSLTPRAASEVSSLRAAKTHIAEAMQAFCPPGVFPFGAFTLAAVEPASRFLLSHAFLSIVAGATPEVRLKVSTHGEHGCLGRSKTP